MSNKFRKITIQIVLLSLNLLRTLGRSLKSIFQVIGKVLGFFLLLVIRFFVLPFLPIYSRIKKTFKEYSSSFHYENGILYFFSQQRILFFLLILVFVFIFFESKASLREEFFARAMVFEDKKNEFSLADFRIASEEEIFIRPLPSPDQDFVPTRTETEQYLVRTGDTISFIAELFGISVNTILWENNLSARSIIRPGQILKILPVSGLSHQVKSGDTIDKIARLYQANSEDIINFNNLEEKRLLAGQTIIVPQGRRPAPPAPPPILRQPTAPSTGGTVWLAEFGGRTRTGTGCRDFYPGQCTWYVAQRYCLTFSGHARDWLTNASRAGHAIGNTPRVGAIISTRETWYGHVGIVEEIRGNSIVISEMNYIRPWVVNYRILPINDRRINGYIYP